MSYTTNDTDIDAAIARSQLHEEIVTIRVKTKKAAWDIAGQLYDKPFEIDTIDTGKIIKMWSMDTDAQWRVHVQYGGAS